MHAGTFIYVMELVCTMNTYRLPKGEMIDDNIILTVYYLINKINILLYFKYTPLLRTLGILF